MATPGSKTFRLTIEWPATSDVNSSWPWAFRIVTKPIWHPWLNVDWMRLPAPANTLRLSVTFTNDPKHCAMCLRLSNRRLDRQIVALNIGGVEIVRPKVLSVELLKLDPIKRTR